MIKESIIISEKIQKAPIELDLGFITWFQLTPMMESHHFSKNSDK